MNQRPPETGERAPEFTVATTEGTRTLAELLAAGPLVLVFYSEDATPLCAAQLGSFRDEHETLRELGAQVLAVSADSIEEHRRFAAGLGDVPFALASDPALELARAYGVADEDARRARRAVFVIDVEGVVTSAQPHSQPGAADQFAAVFRALGLDL